MEWKSFHFLANVSDDDDVYRTIPNVLWTEPIVVCLAEEEEVYTL